jgi:3-methyladenine DNA glycosylase AlkD
MNHKNIIKELKALSTPEKIELLKYFFKTGKNQYAHKDIFWGITVPQIRSIAKKYQEIKIEELLKLLKHDVHEVRLCALLIMVIKSQNQPKKIFNLYINNTKLINNWDLIDLSCPKIVGDYLKDKNKDILYKLAKSKSLWERRIAIVSTFAFIKNNDYKDTLKISKLLLKDKEDLIHKATGWMLRETGKRCSEKILTNFLEEYSIKMPRTMLRYSIEKFSPEKRKYFLQKK